MSPTRPHPLQLAPRGPYVGKPTSPPGLILEAWAQGFMVGALIIMSCITVANMRRGTLLHKLILTELLLAVFHGTFIFNNPPVYGWYLSVTAIGLNASWSLHNVIAWMKNKPFLSRRVSRVYIGTVALAQPYWVLEIYANFTYFNNVNELFLHTRPFEALFRDPWWIFTTISLFWNIKSRYELSIASIIRISPRFGIMLAAMLLSIIFIVVDILSVTGVFDASALPTGINPWWKFSFVFKCLTDTLILDDFKTALDRLREAKLERLGSFVGESVVGDPNGDRLVKGSRASPKMREMDCMGVDDEEADRRAEKLDFVTMLRESCAPAAAGSSRSASSNELQTHGLDKV